jgi:hypothetical protein
MAIVGAFTITAVLLGWVRRAEGFVKLVATIRGDEIRAGTHEWDRALGMLPYVYLREWQVHEVGRPVWTKWEVVRVDPLNATLMLVLCLVVWVMVYLTIRKYRNNLRTHNQPAMSGSPNFAR